MLKSSVGVTQIAIAVSMMMLSIGAMDSICRLRPQGLRRSNAMLQRQSFLAQALRGATLPAPGMRLRSGLACDRAYTV